MDIPPIEIQRQFYRPVCNEKEIDRIFNVTNADDYLLKLRADTIVDNMRLFRVYRNYALANETNWSLEKSFSVLHYTNFLTRLEPDKQDLCGNIQFGNIFSNEPNGQIFKTEYCPIITICDSLKYFFKFMNLGLMDFGKRVPNHISLNSIRIAIRVMLQSEALDFLMDPRGIIPKDIAEDIHKTIPYQMQFIAGHEFAHYILGHLSDKKLMNKPIFKAIFSSQSDYGNEKIYNYSQQNEFDADIMSIQLGNYEKFEKERIFESALIWFASLDLYEAVENYISPPIGYITHPPARDRFENLLKKISMPKDYDYSKWKDLLGVIDSYKDFFIEDVGFNIENYEIYGSVYLDKPDTKWRGKELIDRVDYY